MSYSLIGQIIKLYYKRISGKLTLIHVRWMMSVFFFIYQILLKGQWLFWDWDYLYIQNVSGIICRENGDLY